MQGGGRQTWWLRVSPCSGRRERLVDRAKAAPVPLLRGEAAAPLAMGQAGGASTLRGFAAALLV